MKLAKHYIKILSTLSPQMQPVYLGQLGRQVWPVANPNGPDRSPASSSGLGASASRALNNLEKMGLVKFHYFTEDCRKVYSLTPEGVKAIEENEKNGNIKNL